MKSYYGGPIGNHLRSFERYHPRLPTASSSPRLGVCNPHPKLQSLLSQERMKLYMDFKYGRYIQRVHPNKSPLKILENRERARIQGLPNFLGTPVISAMGKAKNFKFCTLIHNFIWDRSEQKPIKISGVLRDSRKSSGHRYRAHRAVVFAVAQLS